MIFVCTTKLNIRISDCCTAIFHIVFPHTPNRLWFVSLLPLCPPCRALALTKLIIERERENLAFYTVSALSMVDTKLLVFSQPTLHKRLHFAFSIVTHYEVIIYEKKRKFEL